MKWIITAIFLVIWVVSLVYTYGLGALIGKFAPQMAEASMARSAPILMLMLGGYKPCDGVDAVDCGFRDTTGREPVSCSDYSDNRTAVLMTFGQSNSANAGQDKYIPVGDVANFNIHDGQCYAAEDPLLGPDAQGGSVWGVLADQLIVRGHYDRVLIIPFGIGGSAISQWQGEGRFNPILSRALAQVTAANITPTHVLWHQGETDAGRDTSEDEYVSLFRDLVTQIHDAGIQAPVYPAVATYCQFAQLDEEAEPTPGVASVRAAQLRLPEIEGVIQGPDTDVIRGPLYRHDNCHFNAKGMQAHAAAWAAALTQ